MEILEKNMVEMKTVVTKMKNNVEELINNLGAVEKTISELKVRSL